MDIMGTRNFGLTFGHVKIMTLLSLQLKVLVFMLWTGMSIRGASAQTYTKGPTSLPTSSAKFPNTGALIANQTFFLEVGECPQGTIPFLSTGNNGTVSNASTPFNTHREWAYGRDQYHRIFATEVIMNIWTPHVETSAETSSVQLWLTSGYDESTNSALAGYQVNPGYGNYSRLFIYWTADGGGTTGCYDLQCSGFIQVSNKVLIRGAFKYTSSDGDDLYEIKISMFKDDSSHDLWLMLNDEVVGYWPNSIYPDTGMRLYADDLYVGGRVLADDSEDGTTHTKTDMGSGQPASEGFGRAAYIRNIAYINYDHNNYAFVDTSISFYTSHFSCYSIESASSNPTFRTAFFYGGSGLSTECLSDPLG